MTTWIDEAHSILDAAELSAVKKIKKKDTAKLAKLAKKHEQWDKKYVEVTTQPKKKGHGYTGHASFEWKTGPQKGERHSHPVTLSAPAKLSIKGGKLFVKPKGGSEFEWGEAAEEKETEKLLKIKEDADREEKTKADEDREEKDAEKKVDEMVEEKRAEKEAHDKADKAVEEKRAEDKAREELKKNVGGKKLKEKSKEEKEAEFQEWHKNLMNYVRNMPPSAGGKIPLPPKPKVDPNSDAARKKTLELLNPHEEDDNGVGVAARVGIPGRAIQPPPSIPRLPGLDKERREIEESFLRAIESAPKEMANEYARMVMEKAATKGQPPTFVTDDAKVLDDRYRGPDVPANKLTEEDGKKLADFRARNNIAFHQGANAVAKRAFLDYLDELKKLPDGDPKRSVLVTSGGCGAGKGYAIEKGPGTVGQLQSMVGAVWDAAGEQNGTENPWILEECKKRGLKAHFLFVDTDPKVAWADPKRGVVQRATNHPPKGEGRMVDARLFADSYALGAKNFKAFHEAMKNDPDASFIFLNSRGAKPEMAEGLSPEAEALDADELYKFATEVISEKAPSEAIKAGGLVGQGIWGKPGEESVAKPKKKPKPKMAASVANLRTLYALTHPTPRSVMAAAKPVSKIAEELKKALFENYQHNVKNVEKFEEEAGREHWEMSRGFGFKIDKDGNVILPKRGDMKKAKPADADDEGEGEGDGKGKAKTKGFVSAVVTYLRDGHDIPNPADYGLSTDEARVLVAKVIDNIIDDEE